MTTMLGAVATLRRRMLALLGLGEHPGMLPRRLEALVRAQQDRAEVLIGLMQVAAIGLFAVLYAISRAANPPPLAIEPVPIALGLYAIFTGFRLWLALRGRLTDALLLLSVAIDIAVLLITIWSFHLQYMAPLSVVLKSPTVLYLFILISLRALRFEARYVIASGLIGILGWAVLVGASLIGGETRITRSFLDYVTSSAVLIGAEMDKAISIGVVTMVLALIVARGRALMIEAAREQLASTELSRFFVPEIAQRIRGAEEEIGAGMAERREASILFTDLRGFTRLSMALEPVTLLRLLSAYQELVVRAVRHRGGSIDKYLGDGILASFGAVRPDPRHAAAALNAVADIQSALAAQDVLVPDLPPVTIGMAVASGEVLFGTVGAEGRLEYTVIGDAVNLAAKLEKHNKAEACAALTDQATYGRALAQGYRPGDADERRAGRRVAGLDSPVDLVVLRAG